MADLQQILIIAAEMTYKVRMLLHSSESSKKMLAKNDVFNENIKLKRHSDNVMMMIEL